MGKIVSTSSGRVVFSNGKFIPEKDAKISIFDSALMFGDMVFEMTRSFNGKQFKLDEHIERLFNGIKILRIPIQYNQKQLKEIKDENKRIGVDGTFYSPPYKVDSELTIGRMNY